MFDPAKVYPELCKDQIARRMDETARTVETPVATSIARTARERSGFKIVLRAFGLIFLLAASESHDIDLDGLRYAARLIVSKSKSTQKLKPTGCAPWQSDDFEQHRASPCIPPRALL